jgi:hypothetical protein
LVQYRACCFSEYGLIFSDLWVLLFSFRVSGTWP